MQLDGLVNLGDGSEAGKLSHKVPSIISGAQEFNSACSEVLLIFACGLMRSFFFCGSLKFFPIEQIQHVLHLCRGWGKPLSFKIEYTSERKVSFSYLMNRCLHNTAHPTDGSIISSHYGGLREGWDLCGRTERLTSSPPDRAHRGPLTRVVLQAKPKVEFPFYEVSSWCAAKSETCVKGSECQGPLSVTAPYRNNGQKGPVAWMEGIFHGKSFIMNRFNIRKWLKWYDFKISLSKDLNIRSEKKKFQR